MKKNSTLKRIILSSLFAVFISLGINAQDIVTNGGYESWTAGDPDGWTTIESGITVTEETTTIHGGSKSASVEVTTGTQGDTDFRQEVNVTAGVTYDVSVWVYHTEGNVKARMYVGDYRDYSDNTITGQWQELTYTYLAGSTTTISLGFRFYDQSGFDGSEIVYVDDYTMTPQVSTSTMLYLEGFDAGLGATTQYSVTGAEEWEYASSYGNPAGCSKMSGYSGGAQDNEDWLITEAIDCSSYTNITLHFDHARNYGDNNGLYVMVSTDYDGTGDPNNFTWTDLSSQFTFPDPGGWSFIDAGTVDITANTGATTYIAFKYTSTTAGAATWEVDNITLQGDFNVSAFVAGSFNAWNAADPDYELSLNANDVMELTKNMASGTHEYKIVEDGSWYPNNNQTFTLATAEDVTWKWNYHDNLVTHTAPVVAGNFLSQLGGNDWDPTELLGEMADVDGDDIYTLTLTIPAGSYECKVTFNHNWDQSTGGNVPFTTDGVTPTVFTYEFATNTTTVSGPAPPQATVTFIVYDTIGQNYDGFNLKGSWDVDGNYDPAWNGGNEHTPFYDDGTNGDVTAGDHVWTCQQDLTADNGANSWEWGVNDSEHNWIAGNWTFQVIDDSPQTQTWEVPSSPGIVINEIMYNSIGADEEWIELYNPTDASIDLENWKLLDSDPSHSPIIITAGYSIGSGEYFTIKVFDNGNFPFTPDFDGSGNFGLNNGDDVVRIYNPDGILMDYVHYYDNGDWPSEADGDGPSLSLLDPTYDNSIGTNWDASREDWGTPGAENFPPLPIVTVTAPNGGESVEKETYYDITWTYANWTGDVKIEIYRDGQEPDLITTNIPVSDTVYSWYVFESLDEAADYKIVISGLNEDDPTDESDDFFSIIPYYNIPQLVLTEIMYNPPESGTDSLEFVEVYNNGDDTVNMDGIYFSQGFDFTFPAVNILPDSFVLVAADSMAMLGTFNVNAYQWLSGGLSNGGEDIEIKDMFDNVLDYVDYDDYLPWDTLADGYGPSLTLCNPDVDNNIAENWTHSVNPAAINSVGDSIWATPGTQCAVDLQASFEADLTQITLGNSVNFTDLSIGDITSWQWTFEGGAPATYDGQTPPPVTYNTAGSFDVTLQVSDGSNTSEVTYTDYINVIELLPPTNLMAEVGPLDDVTLTWSAPGETELIYDNDEVTGAYSYEGYTMSTHMSPDQACKLLKIKYYTTFDEGEDNSFDANIYLWNDTVPATDILYTEVANAVNDAWTVIDVSAQDLNFTTDFVVGFGSINATTYVGYDANLNNGRSWDFDNDATWTPWTEAYVIRAVVEYTDGKIAELGITDTDINIDRNFAASSHPIVNHIGETVEPIQNMANGGRALLGYNVYRDDVMLNTETVLETTYYDAAPSIGSHDYYVTAVYDEGESDASNIVSIVVTDVNEFGSDNISIYPNPASDKLNISLTEKHSYAIVMMDIRGKVVYNSTIENDVTINTTMFEKGMYLIKLQDVSTKEAIVKKVIIK